LSEQRSTVEQPLQQHDAARSHGALGIEHARRDLEQLRTSLADRRPIDR
jgi:hypothetical protein